MYNLTERKYTFESESRTQSSRKQVLSLLLSLVFWFTKDCGKKDSRHLFFIIVNLGCLCAYHLVGKQQVYKPCDVNHITRYPTRSYQNHLLKSQNCARYYHHKILSDLIKHSTSASMMQQKYHILKTVRNHEYIIYYISLYVMYNRVKKAFYH